MGMGEPVNGDKIYHGTLDNASGSAALLEIAQAMAGLHPRPRRSILFVSVTGEEEGLLGADYFAHYPTVPKSAMVADVNMDEDIMLWPLEDIVAYGAEHSSLGAVVNEAAERLASERESRPAARTGDFHSQRPIRVCETGNSRDAHDMRGTNPDNPAIHAEERSRRHGRRRFTIRLRTT